MTNPGDPIVAIYNTKAGEPIGGMDGVYAAGESHINAIDNNLTTKYLNFGARACLTCGTTDAGTNTGYIIQPLISNTTIARAILFATADDFFERDPLTVTLEGATTSDTTLLSQGSSWNLIYNGSTGINPNIDPGRKVYGTPQNFFNTIPYRSYRLLVTSRRDLANSVQYAESHILGYVVP